MLRLLIAFICLLPQILKAQNLYSGKVLDRITKEPLIGVTIQIINSSTGCITDNFGLFKIQAKSTDSLKLTYLGYTTQYFALQEKQKKNLVIFMVEHQTGLAELTIAANDENKVLPAKAGINNINSKMLDLVPAIAGEKDIIRTVQLMPGVKSGADGLGGMYVRGGNTDQNLVLLNGATVYNPSHLVGFFSVFNSNIISNTDMYKGNFPARFGSRVSSVLDISTQKANTEKLSAAVSLGLLLANIKINAPIIKNKTAIVFAARRSYIDKLYKIAGNELPYFFSDLNATISHTISQNAEVSLNHYQGVDVLQLSKNSEQFSFGSNMGNLASSINYKFQLPNSVFKTTISQSRYNYGFTSNLQGSIFNLHSYIQEVGFNSMVSYNLKNKQVLSGGIGSMYNLYAPNKTNINGKFNQDIKDQNAKNLAVLNCYTFIDYDKHWQKFSLNTGLRFSNASQANFNYFNLEPRLTLGYILKETDKISFSYNKMVQPVHLINSSGILMPSDIWYPVTKNIKPQIAHQMALSYQTTIKSFNIMVEAYYKHLNNLIEYKEGTVVFLNNQLENDLISGKAKSYGAEFLIQKNAGKFTGWISYTLSWSNRQFSQINFGKTFSAVFDRRHDFNLVAGYKIYKNFSVNTLLVCASGSKVTPIIGNYFMPSGSLNDLFVVPIYGKRNSQSLAVNFRLDFGLTYTPTPKRKYVSEWQIGAYNVFNRTQPFRVKINNESGKLNYQQLGLFGFVPSISYNLKF